MDLYKSFSDDTLNLSAYYLGSRIQMNEIEGIRNTDSRAYIIENKDGAAYLFRYGVAILVNMTQEAELAFLEQHILPKVHNPITDVETEFTTIILDTNHSDSATFSSVRIKSLDNVRLEIIADIIAKSVVLGYYEKQISDTFDKIDTLASHMQAGKYPTAKGAKEYLKHIGLTLSVQRNMVGRVEVTDKPEVLWDQPPELHKFYSKLEDEYEIIERHEALKEKLEIIHRTAETMTDILQARQTHHVEWYIVILIVVDIVLGLSEKIFQLF